MWDSPSLVVGLYAVQLYLLLANPKLKSKSKYDWVFIKVDFSNLPQPPAPSRRNTDSSLFSCSHKVCRHDQSIMREQPPTHLTTRTSLNLASNSMAAKSKVVWLVELDPSLAQQQPKMDQISLIAPARLSLAQLSPSLSMFSSIPNFDYDLIYRVFFGFFGQKGLFLGL